MPTKMALHHFNLVVNIRLSLPRSWVEGLIPCVLRGSHHGKHCLQLKVGIKLRKFCDNREKKNTRERERKGFVTRCISSVASQESGSWAWREGRQRKVGLHLKENGRIWKGEEAATHLQWHWLAKGSKDAKWPVKRVTLPLAFAAPWLTVA